MKMNQLLAAVLLLTPAALRGQVLTNGQLITSFSGGSSVIVAPATLGFSFLIGPHPIAVQALGVLDAGELGLTASHEVAIWDMTPPVPTMVAEATVEPSGVEINGFVYAPLTAHITLAVGKTYIIAAQYSGFDRVILGITNGVPLAGAVFGNAQLAFGPGLNLPTIPAPSADYGFIGPNFSLEAIAEPGTAILAICGAITLLAWRQWRKA
jgi:hypothetical protein